MVCCSSRGKDCRGCPGVGARERSSKIQRSTTGLLDTLRMDEVEIV